MRKRGTLLCVLLMGGLAVAQGTRKRHSKEDMQKGCMASTGFVASEFLKDLEKQLTDQFGKERAAEMMKAFAAAKLKPRDSLGLLNGKATKSDLKAWFKIKDRELEGCQKSLEHAVDEKDKNLFFGLMFQVMTGDFDVDPTGEFCKQACGAKDEMKKATWEKLKQGNRSKRTLTEGFGFSNKDDLKFLQDIINRVMESPMLNHPMCESMGLGNARQFSKDDFPEMGQGMAGFGEHQDGRAGGQPFPADMPPCPFFGENMGPFGFGGKDTGHDTGASR